MAAVPADVIVPTSDTSLDAVTNPINGRRGGVRPRADEPECVLSAADRCLVVMLDRLGFDVTGDDSADRDLRVARAVAVVQLDAGLPMTGVADDALFEYLAMVVDEQATQPRPAERRVIGSSQEGRQIVALRYGDGPRVVLVVGQTHGDEEGGLRVLLRALTLQLPEGVAMWFVPTMNPDGWSRDTRFLLDGSDPNRAAPSGPEQDAVVGFALEIRPTLSVWYHQNYGWVGGSGASFRPAQHYQELTALGTLKRSGDCATRGFMWCPIDDALGASSILVELPDVLTPAEVQLHAQALLDVAAADS